MHYEKNRVGAIMEFGVILVRPDVTLGAVQRYLRRLGKMPNNTDKLFVTSRDKTLLGELDLQTILLHGARTSRDQSRIGVVWADAIFHPPSVRVTT